MLLCRQDAKSNKKGLLKHDLKKRMNMMPDNLLTLKMAVKLNKNIGIWQKKAYISEVKINDCKKTDDKGQPLNRLFLYLFSNSSFYTKLFCNFHKIFNIAVYKLSVNIRRKIYNHYITAFY